MRLYQEPVDSQAVQKLHNYLVRFIETDYVQQEVKRLRKRYDIPKNGIKLTKKVWADFEQPSIIYVPEKLKKIRKEDKEYLKDLWRGLEKIYDKFPLLSPYVEEIIKFYVFHNYILTIDELPEKNKHWFEVYGLCFLSDDRRWRKEFEWHLDDDTKTIADEDPENGYLASIVGEQEVYPISIKLHPQASQRDVLDFVKKNWNEIEKLQKHYQSEDYKIKPVRKTNKHIKERNDFIYKNKKLPLKEIFKLVSDNYDEVLDEGHIAKIISLEKKRRKEL